MLDPNQKLVSVIPSEKDLGGFTVRRAIPTIQLRNISYFVFFDHMGPAQILRAQGMNVRPHLHIALATETFLFEDSIVHRDSIGSTQLIKPGDVNWMTAGHGIVHSERSPPEGEAKFTMHGLQIWVALPKAKEEMPASFQHYPKESLPQFKKDDADVTLILGSYFGRTSPVQIESNIFYYNVKLARNGLMNLEFTAGHECRLYIIAGTVKITDFDSTTDLDVFSASCLVVLKLNQKYKIVAQEDSHFVVLGGEALPEPRYMWWNFISTSKERIETAKKAWLDQSMGQVLGETEFIPLPAN